MTFSINDPNREHAMTRAISQIEQVLYTAKTNTTGGRPWRVSYELCRDWSLSRIHGPELVGA